MEELLDRLGLTKDATLTFAVRAAAVVLVTAILVKIVNALFKRALKNRSISGRSHGYLSLVRYVLLIALYIVAGMSILSGNIKTSLSALLASSGIAAVVLGIACQETIGNIFGGVVIIFSHPFRIGDVIRYLDRDISGTVEEVTLRHTVVRTFENRRLIIPNGVINRSSIENSSFSDRKICMFLDFSVTYDSDIDLAIQTISDVILMHPHYFDVRSTEDMTAGAPPVLVLVNELADSAVVIRARVWVRDFSLSLNMKNDILLETYRRFKDAGLNFAYPHVEVVRSHRDD
ncbi:MAG: mechanosensitive ion channel family protein [Oscillospiraceae bacterium]|jgi:small-conductance mechanosensitive channel|nr:mechanosensitive ion channel family protein [Oscillospiraceae bacterium]